MKKSRHVVLFFLALLLLASILLVGGMAPEAGAQGETTLTREETLYSAGAQWGAAGHFNPFAPSPAAGTGLMYEGLFWFNHYAGEFNPWLAESYEWVDSYTFRITLREGPRWRDGTPVTAEDVVFTFETMRKYDQLISEWKGTESVQAIGNRTVQINLKENYPNYVHVKGYLGTMIVNKERWLAIEDEYVWRGQDLLDFVNAYPDQMEGSGPYLLIYEDSSRLIYKRNDNWWGNAIWGQPAPKYYCHRIFTTNEAGAMAFRNGEIDWHSMWIGNPTETIQTLGWAKAWDTNNPNGYIYRPTCPILLVPNLNESPLNEPWLRRAISYAIDRESISEIANDGVLSVLHPSYLPVYAPYVESYIDEGLAAQYPVEYNTTKARQILENYATWNEAEGAWYYDYDNDGVEEKIGPFDVEAVSGWNDSMMQAYKIAQYLKAIGIPAQESYSEYNLFINNMRTMNFDFQVQPITPHLGPNSPVYEYDQLFTGTGGFYRNWCDYTESPNYDKVENLVDEMSTLPIGSQRSIELCKEVQKIIIPECPYIPLLNQGDWGTFSTQYWEGWPTKDNAYTGRQHCWDDHNGVFPVLMNIRATGKVSGGPSLPVAAIVFVVAIAIIVVVYYIKRKSSSGGQIG